MEEHHQRPYEPIAKTLEAYKENTVDSDTVQDLAHIASSSESLASGLYENMDLSGAHGTEVSRIDAVI